MSQVIKADPTTGVGIIINTKYTLPKYDIGTVVRVKTGATIKIVEICMQTIQTDKGIETDIYYGADNDTVIDEDDIITQMDGD
jgi:hypothetical protein